MKDDGYPKEAPLAANSAEAELTVAAQHEQKSPSFSGSLGFLIGLFAIILFLVPQVSLVSQRVVMGLQERYWQLDNEEAALLWQSWLVRDGSLPYNPLGDSPPWVVGTYPPLTYALVAMLTPAENQRVAPDYRPFRVVVAFFGFLSITVTGFLVATALRGLEARLWIALGLVAATLFGTTFEFHRWIPYARVDFPALGFSLLGLWLFLLADRGNHRRQRLLGYVLSAAALVAAGYCKQSALAVPMTIVFGLLWDRRWKDLVVWGSLYASFGIVPFVILTWATAGQFPLHTIIYNANTLHLETLWIWARHGVRFHGFWLVALGALILGAFLIRNRGQSAKSQEFHFPQTSPTSSCWVRAFFLYFLFSWAQSLTIAKAGSAENYLLEPLAATAILTATLLGLLFQSSSRPLPRLALSFAMVGLLLHGFNLQGWVGWAPPTKFTYQVGGPGPRDRQAQSELLRMARSAQKRVLSEFAHLHLALGQPVVYQPFIMSELARQGKWDPSPFLKTLRNETYRLVVLQQPLAQSGPVFTQEMIAALEENFEEAPQSPLVGERTRTFVFVPRQPYP
jgi:hypothetical protein